MERITQLSLSCVYNAFKMKDLARRVYGNPLKTEKYGEIFFKGLLSNHFKAWTGGVNSQTSKLSQPAVRLFVVGSNATLINACRTMPGTQQRDG
jgi:hypothetical protein